MRSVVLISLFTSVLISIISCNSKMIQKKPSLMEEKLFRSEKFKYYTFLSCLRRGYNKSDLVDEFLNKETIIDDFTLGINNYRYMDSIANFKMEEIVQDSIEYYNKWIKNNQDYIYGGLTGKRVIYHCLELYESEMLDSIAFSRAEPVSLD